MVFIYILKYLFFIVFGYLGKFKILYDMKEVLFVYE